MVQVWISKQEHSRKHLAFAREQYSDAVNRVSDLLSVSNSLDPLSQQGQDALFRLSDAVGTYLFRYEELGKLASSIFREGQQS